jgi:hypothetical protein
MSPAQTFPSFWQRYGVAVIVMGVVGLNWTFGDSILIDSFDWDVIQNIITIAGPVVAICQINTPKPTSADLSLDRTCVNIPNYVETTRYLSGAAIILSFILMWTTGSSAALGIGFAIYFGVSEWGSRRFHRADEEAWSIAYYSEVNGYFKDDGQ